MEDHNLIVKSLQYIDNHLEDAITVAEIAERIGYSEFHFSRCFRNEMQISVMEYVTHPFNTAIILAQMNADIYVIYAGIFWDAVKKQLISHKSLEDKLQENAMNILQKANENESKIPAIEYLDEEKRKFRAKETLDMIMQFSERITDEKIRNELNDLALRYLE